MTIDLKGKCALITGATGQLGRTMARTLAASGADVVLHYLKNADMAQTLATEIESMGRCALVVQADITKEESVKNMQEVIAKKAEFAHINIVVNNAVVQYEWTSILNQPLENFSSQFESCTMQSVLTAKAFLPAMLEKGQGRFIGVNTECQALCNANSGAYAAAKRGMDGLYRVLAKEVGVGGVGWRGYISAELGFVGCPGEIEVEFAGEAGLVDYGAVDDSALEDGGEVSHRCVAGWHQEMVGVDGADEFRGIVGWGLAWLQLRAAFCKLEFVDGELFLLAVEGELEPVGEESADHGHLFVVIGADVAGGDGGDVVVGGVEPGRAAGDGTGVEIVGGGDEKSEGV